MPDNFVRPAMTPFVAAPTRPDALRRRAREDGFVYLPRLLPEDRLSPLRTVVDAALGARGWVVNGRTDPSLRLGGWDDARWVTFLAEVAATEAYRTLAAAPEILDVVRQILEAEPRFYVGHVCRLVSPGAVDLTTPPHQDVAYVTDASEVWTAWFPLGPCPLALGPLALLAGSHTGGMRPHAMLRHGGGGIDVSDDAPWCSGDLEAGDVIVFSALTVHRALPNVTTDQLRVSVDYRYRPAR
jgi:ectoine hydroxylase-related dioxygenase (phytanoyl-CoA dioxygenase family)